MELHFSPDMDYATTLLWDKGKERPGGKNRKADGYTYSIYIYIYQENEENLSLKLQMRHVQNIKCQQEKNHTPNDNFKCYLKRFEKTRALWNESLQTVVLSLPALNVLSR